MKNTWKSLLVIILSAILYSFLDRIVPTNYASFIQFIYLVILVVIGFFLAPTHKKNNRWLGKVIVSLVIVFIFGIRMNWFVLTEFYDFLIMIGLYGSFLDIILIYCGWVFYQV